MSLPDVLEDRLRIPVVAAPMFIASGPELVSAQCRAGVVGSFPALNARPASQLRDWLSQVGEEVASYARNHPDRTVAPYAVNQIVHRSNERLEQDMATIADYKVPIVITSLGARTEINDAVHSYGGLVFHDVIDDRFAKKAIEKGADGLIAVAAGAGGHAGTVSPFALIQEIRRWFDGPLALSGSIAHGRSILAAQAAGADLAYVGSAFLATHEARAHPNYKRMIVESTSKDIVYSNLFTGVHGNYLRGSIEAAGLDPDDLQTSDASAMNFGFDNTGVKAWKDVWGSGQGIGVVDATVSVNELVTRLSAEYRQALSNLTALAASEKVRAS